MKREDIEHLSTLSRIELADEEKESMAREVGEILEYVSAISTIAGSEKKKEATGVFNVFREDVPTHEPGEYTEALLSAAPNRKGQYVAVKKILENKESKHDNS